MNDHYPENSKKMMDQKCKQQLSSTPIDTISSNIGPQSSSSQHPSHFSIDYRHIIDQHFGFDQLSSQQLLKSNITKQNRARLKFWLSQECSRGVYTRQTYAAACKYLDIYISKNSIELNSFQTLGLACFVLAAKTIQSKPPPISFSVFNKAQILNYQKKILIDLKFRVQPLTYVKIADILFLYWDRYCQQNCIFYLSYFQNNQKSIKCYQSMLEILDALNLIPETLDFQIPSLVISLFFFENRVNCQGGKHPKTQKEAWKLLNIDDKYRNIFENFFRYIVLKCEVFENAHFTEEIMELIVPFLNLKTRLQKISPSQLSSFWPTYIFHTHNPHSFPLAKSRMAVNRQS